jgi:hypothetical protein
VAPLPFSIPTARLELSPSYVASINRVLYDIAHELDRKLNAPSRPEDETFPGGRSSARDAFGRVGGLPIRIVFGAEDAKGAGDAITVTPVPFQFNRSIRAWSQAAVLDWQVLKQSNNAIDTLGFDFAPGALLPGILYRALESRPADERHDGVLSIIGCGESRTRRASEFYDCQFATSEAKESRKGREKQELPPELSAHTSSNAKKELKRQVDETYLSVLDRIDPRCQRFIVLTPIHDIRPYGHNYGPPTGCLLLNIGLTRYANTPLDEHNPITDTMHADYVAACHAVGRRLVPRLNRSAELLAVEIHKAAMVQVNQETALASRELLEHYVSTLRHVQYWERVHVYSHGKYCFSYAWKQGASSASGWTRIDSDPQNELLRSDKAHFAPFGCPSAVRVRNCLSCEAREAIDPVVDTGVQLEPHEIASLDGAQFLFEFPSVAVVPLSSDEYITAFCRELQNQQLEVLRAVLPLRRARRNALRTAVSAIMGRNMSHNIGSHVLARYSSKARNDIQPAANDEADHRGDLLSYLQRRMDFIAEVATTDQPLGSQVLDLREVVERLNYGRQAERFQYQALYTADGKFRNPCRVDSSCLHHLMFRPANAGLQTEEPKDPILLSYISGKETVRASVEYGFPALLCAAPQDRCGVACDKGYRAAPRQPDYAFSCPGGEVGAQAFYVILENIMRNSARHGGDGAGPVRLFVNVLDGEDPDFLTVDIVDPHTALREDGCLTPAKSDKWATQQLESGSNSRSLFATGKRQKLARLPSEINRILEAEPLLEASGSPNPDYWGVREMQICAHLLRGGALSEVEGEIARTVALQADVETLATGWCLKYRLQLQRPKLLAAVVCDASPWASETLRLRRYGVVVQQLNPGAEPRHIHSEWRRVAQAAGRYAFLLVEKEIVLPGTEERVLLPVRTWNASLEQIQGAVHDALTGKQHFIEPLHERTLKQYQERDAWKDRALYGLVLASGSVRRERDTGNPPRGRLFVSARARPEDVGTTPLPASLSTWLEALRGSDSMAAVWVDHCGAKDFGLFEVTAAGAGAQLRSAAVPRAMDATAPFWVCAEGAFTDSAHTDFINRIGIESAGTELLAAALARVIVLDERVQSGSTREARGGLPLRELWPLTGVWVPSVDGNRACDLNTPDKSAIHNFLKEPTLCTDQWPADFLIIHLTILEKLGENLPDVLGELTCGTPAERAQIVIVTGRGVPALARRADQRSLRSVRFLPVSAVLEPLVLRPSKLGLMRTLWSASRPTHDLH